MMQRCLEGTYLYIARELGQLTSFQHSNCISSVLVLGSTILNDEQLSNFLGIFAHVVINVVANASLNQTQ